MFWSTSCMHKARSLYHFIQFSILIFTAGPPLPAAFATTSDLSACLSHLSAPDVVPDMHYLASCVVNSDQTLTTVFDECPACTADGYFRVLCGVDNADTNIRLSVKPNDDPFMLGALPYSSPGFCVKCKSFAKQQCTATGEVLVGCGTLSNEPVNPYTWIGTESGHCEICASLNASYCDSDFRSQHAAVLPDIGSFYFTDCYTRQHEFVHPDTDALQCEMCDPTRCAQGESLRFCGGDFEGICSICVTAAFLNSEGTTFLSFPEYGAQYSCLPVCAPFVTGTDCSEMCEKTSTLSDQHQNGGCGGDVSMFATHCEPPLQARCTRCSSIVPVGAVQTGYIPSNMAVHGSFDNMLFFDETADIGPYIGTSRRMHSAVDAFTFFDHMYVRNVWARPQSNADVDAVECKSQSRQVYESFVLHPHSCSSTRSLPAAATQAFLVMTVSQNLEWWIGMHLVSSPYPSSQVNGKVAMMWLSSTVDTTVDLRAEILMNGEPAAYVPDYRVAVALQSDRWTFIRFIMKASQSVPQEGTARDESAMTQENTLEFRLTCTNTSATQAVGLAVDNIVVQDYFIYLDFEDMTVSELDIGAFPGKIWQPVIDMFVISFGDPQWTAMAAPLDIEGFPVAEAVGDKALLFNSTHASIYIPTRHCPFSSTWVTFEFMARALDTSCTVVVTADASNFALHKHFLPANETWHRVSFSFDLQLVVDSISDNRNKLVWLRMEEETCSRVLVDDILIWEKPGDCSWWCGDIAVRNFASCVPCHMDRTQCQPAESTYPVACTVDGFHTETLCQHCSNAPLQNAVYVFTEADSFCDWRCEENYFPQYVKNSTVAGDSLSPFQCVACERDVTICPIGYYLSACVAVDEATGLALPPAIARDSVCLPCKSIEQLEDPRARDLAFFISHGRIYDQDSCDFECGEGLWKDEDSGQCFPCTEMDCSTLEGSWYKVQCSFAADAYCQQCPLLAPNAKYALSYEAPVEIVVGDEGHNESAACRTTCLPGFIKCAECGAVCDADDNACWATKNVDILAEIDMIDWDGLNAILPTAASSSTVLLPVVEGVAEMPRDWAGALIIPPSFVWAHEVGRARMLWNDVSRIAFRPSVTDKDITITCGGLLSCRVMLEVRTHGWTDISFVTWINAVNTPVGAVRVVALVFEHPDVGGSGILHKEILDLSGTPGDDANRAMFQWSRSTSRPGTYYFCFWFATTRWSIMGVHNSYASIAYYDAVSDPWVFGLTNSLLSMVPRGVSAVHATQLIAQDFPAATQVLQKRTMFSGRLQADILNSHFDLFPVSPARELDIYRRRDTTPREFVEYPVFLAFVIAAEYYVSMRNFANGTFYVPSSYTNTSAASGDLMWYVTCNTLCSISFDVEYYIASPMSAKIFRPFFRATAMDFNDVFIENVLSTTRLSAEPWTSTSSMSTWWDSLRLTGQPPPAAVLQRVGIQVPTVPKGEYGFMISVQHNQPDTYSWGEWPFVYAAIPNITIVSHKEEFACTHCSFWEGTACVDCKGQKFPANATVFADWDPATGDVICNWRCDGDFILDVYGLGCTYCPMASCSVGYYQSKCGDVDQPSAVCQPCSMPQGPEIPSHVVFASSGSGRFEDNCNIGCMESYWRMDRVENLLDPHHVYFLGNTLLFRCFACSVKACVDGTSFRVPCSARGDEHCQPCTAQCPATQRRVRDCNTTSDTACETCDASSLLPNGTAASTFAAGARAVFARSAGESDVSCRPACEFAPPLDGIIAQQEQEEAVPDIPPAELDTRSNTCVPCRPKCQPGFFATGCSMHNAFTGCEPCTIPANAEAVSAGAYTDNSCVWECKAGFSKALASGTVTCLLMDTDGLPPDVSDPQSWPGLPCINFCALGEFQVAPPSCECLSCSGAGLQKPNGSLSVWTEPDVDTGWGAAAQCTWECVAPYVTAPNASICVEFATKEVDDMLDIRSKPGDVFAIDHLWVEDRDMDSFNNGTSTLQRMELYGIIGASVFLVLLLVTCAVCGTHAQQQRIPMHHSY